MTEQRVAVLVLLLEQLADRLGERELLGEALVERGPDLGDAVLERVEAGGHVDGPSRVGRIAGVRQR